MFTILFHTQQILSQHPLLCLCIKHKTGNMKTADNSPSVLHHASIYTILVNQAKFKERIHYKHDSMTSQNTMHITHWTVEYSIIVSIWVTNISNAIPVSILLTWVRYPHTVVLVATHTIQGLELHSSRKFSRTTTKLLATLFKIWVFITNEDWNYGLLDHITWATVWLFIMRWEKLQCRISAAYSAYFS